MRNRIRFPHSVSEGARIAVICPENSLNAQTALELGAVAVGEETIFNMVRAEGGLDAATGAKKTRKDKGGENGGKKDISSASSSSSSSSSSPGLPFDRLICHQESEAALRKANLGRFLGPRGLMPNTKTNTIVSNVRESMYEIASATEFRERVGVIRLPIGRLNFTPTQLSENIEALIQMLKAEVPKIDPEGRYMKMLHEVVLSSTHGPGFSLNGRIDSTDKKVGRGHLCGPM